MLHLLLGKIASISAALLVLLLFLTPSSLAQSEEPLDSIKGTVEGIITLLTDEKYKKDEAKQVVRRQRIVELIEHRFNFELMAKLALGDTWNERSEAERILFVQLFSDLLKNTYIRRIETYSDEKVSFNKQVMKNNLAMVYSLFQRSNSEFSIVYKLKKAENDWCVYDVIIEGASIIKQYRRQFSQIVKQEKFQGLIKRLEAKTKDITLT